MVRFENVSYVIVKSFLPYIALASIKKAGEATAYNIIQHVQEELNVVLSAGTMYSTIYGLERQGYIKGKTRYRLTDKGMALLQNSRKTMKEILPKVEAFIHFGP
jgi:DNA-binding PadR family transcriptional regulator